VTSDNCAAVEKTDVVVLAVKPQNLKEVLEELKGHIQPQQIVLSIIAGATLATIRDGLGHEVIARVMPNIPAQVGEGMSVWTATNGANDDDKETVRGILDALGGELYVKDEKDIDLATAVSGCGPGYIFMIIEAFIDGAVQIGLPRDMAEQLTVQTVLGSAVLVKQTEKSPTELKNQVITPGGSTEEGLRQLEQGGLSAVIAKAVSSAYQKTLSRKQ
jgi:pyrroline-5-carboxylate reductase